MSDSVNLTLALAFHIIGAAVAIWLIVELVLADGGWGAQVPDPLATIVFVVAIALWLTTPLLMIRWRHHHPRLLWLLPALCVGVILALALLADAATTKPSPTRAHWSSVLMYGALHDRTARAQADSKEGPDERC